MSASSILGAALVSDIPQPGTWVRLARTSGLSAGKWHHVVGWDLRGRCLRLTCTSRDRNISWALGGAGEFGVQRSDGRPDQDVCARCHTRAATAVGPARPKA